MTDDAPAFIHLRVRSSLSILESMIRPKELAAWAADSYAPAVAVTDDNNLYAALELSEGLSGAGVQPITGVTLSIYDPKLLNDEPTELALLAQNEAGYLNLMALSSKAFLEAPAAGPGVTLDDVLAVPEGVICLTGGGAGLAARLAAAGRKEDARALLKRLKAAFGDQLYVELQRHDCAIEDEAEEMLVDLAYELDLPLVATNDARFMTTDQHGSHDALMCIGRSAYLSQDDRVTATPEQYLKTPAAMAELFSDLPEAIENTVEIARRCAFRPEGKAPILPNFTGDDGDEGEELVRQAKEGLKARLDGATLYADETVYWERLEYELGIIRQMGFPGYFLIVADFIKWAKEQDIPVGPGRGSGAGSVVAWALTITDLDPMRFGLLFERFLNPERVSMPDF
ncbi:MAG: PHP domain-containing protein, partial [Pseudomonadota bacterium]